MLGIELQQTRVYREAKAEGETIGEARGEAKEQIDLETQIKTLPLAQLEELGEALLDFSQMDDLVTWLNKIDRA
jgi:predicted transposase YdaD